MFFSFDENVAKVYGVDGAIFIQNLYWWINKNRINGRHFYEGRYWTYNSVSAWIEVFPFWTDKQIRRIIDNLREMGALHIGEFNKSRFDRTRWYALDEVVLELCRSGQTVKQESESGDMDLPKRANDSRPNGQMTSAQTGGPIPDINTDIKPVKEKELSDKPDMSEQTAYCEPKGSISELCNEVIEHLNQRTGKKYKATSDKTKKLICARIREGFALTDFYSVIDNKGGQWSGTDMDKYLRPETLFGPKFEGYLNERVKNAGENEYKPGIGGKTEKVYGTVL